MSCKLAVVGANSAVGEVLLELIEGRQLNYAALHVLALDPQEEEQVRVNKKTITAQNINDFDFSTIDLVFFVDEEGLAGQYAQAAADAGAYVIDCSAHFRQAEDVPLVVPEVNGQVLDSLEKGALIASPSPASIFLSLVLKPLMAKMKLTRVAICSMHPVSGAGKRGVDELAGQTVRLLNGLEAEVRVFPKQVAFNLLPQTSGLSEQGYSAEEMDLLTETKRLLDAADFHLNPTCIQAPVFYAHSQVIGIEADRPLGADEVSAILSKAPGLKLSRKNDGGPTAVQDASGADLVSVGRIRQSLDNDREINLWCVGDDLRKGAALNAVQIAEILLKNHLQ